MNDVEEMLNFLNEKVPILFHVDLWITEVVKIMVNLTEKARQKFTRNKTIANCKYYKALRNYTKLAQKLEKKDYIIFFGTLTGIIYESYKF